MAKVTSKFEPSTLVMVKRRKKYEPASRAVIAKEAIEKGAIIEKCPVIKMPYTEVFDDEDGDNHSLNPTISHYVFNWSDDRTALALGYGSLYNHSKKPNASYKQTKDDCLVFTAIRDIKKGEEVTIDYYPEELERNISFCQSLEQ